MISDTLSDAADDIRRQLKDFPQAYAAVEGEIQALVAGMDSLRVRLDTPPEFASASDAIASVYAAAWDSAQAATSAGPEREATLKRPGGGR